MMRIHIPQKLNNLRICLSALKAERYRIQGQYVALRIKKVEGGNNHGIEGVVHQNWIYEPEPIPSLDILRLIHVPIDCR